MKKDREIRNITIISAILSGFSAFMGCMCVVFPKFAISLLKITLSITPVDIEPVLAKGAVPLMLARSLLPLAFTVVAVINAVSDKYSQTKGIATVVFTSVAYVVIAIASSGLMTLAMNISARQSADMTAIASLVNSAVAKFSFINVLAIMLIISASSIEIYASKKFGGE